MSYYGWRYTKIKELENARQELKNIDNELGNAYKNGNTDYIERLESMRMNVQQRVNVLASRLQ